jgi:large conductance mechanosensitive channel
MKNFVQFIREQGVVGFATGFILGGAVSDLIKSLMADIVNPLLGLLLGSVSGLKSASVPVLGATVTWGNFLTVFINFIVLSAVVYILFKVLGLDRLDKKKDA